jgi:1-acyl-sn-glycerol-3-phosphate acyltransferase
MLRVFLFISLIVWVLLWIVPVTLAHLFKKKKLRAKMTQYVTRGMIFLCGVRVKKIGEIASARPLLLACNHLSYLDIPILESLIDSRFIAKKEIAKWPVVNSFCRLQDVVFIDRSAGKISEGNAQIASKLAEGEVVTLFPEATTGDGKRLLPFKPAFFEAAAHAPVQPVAISYRKIRGLPIDYGQWPLVAWYGDMVLLPHLWKLLSLGRIEVEVHFLPPLYADKMDRKDIALQSHSAIESALTSQALAKS